MLVGLRVHTTKCPRPQASCLLLSTRTGQPIVVMPTKPAYQHHGALGKCLHIPNSQSLPILPKPSRVGLSPLSHLQLPCKSLVYTGSVMPKSVGSLVARLHIGLRVPIPLQAHTHKSNMRQPALQTVAGAQCCAWGLDLYLPMNLSHHLDDDAPVGLVGAGSICLRKGFAHPGKPTRTSLPTR